MKTFLRILAIIALLIFGILFNGMSGIYHNVNNGLLSTAFHVLTVICFGAAVLLPMAWRVEKKSVLK